MSDNISNITIRVADLPRIPLRIPRDEVETARKAEASINELWTKWSQMDSFAGKSSAEVLAMVTFRFAQLYYGTIEASQSLDEVLETIEDAFDDILHADILHGGDRDDSSGSKSGV